jgi:hypothetical protein
MLNSARIPMSVIARLFSHPFFGDRGFSINDIIGRRRLRVSLNDAIVNPARIAPPMTTRGCSPKESSRETH